MRGKSVSTELREARERERESWFVVSVSGSAARRFLRLSEYFVLLLYIRLHTVHILS